MNLARWPLSPRPYAVKDISKCSVVALGGGTGLSTLLRSLKQLRLSELIAVVTVTDDGGSTGRLRREMDIPAVGDLRNCLVALAADDELLSRLFDHRFGGDGSLAGHSLGNLLMAGLVELTGDFAEAVTLAGEVLKIRGKILPSTAENVHLVGIDALGRRLEGECEVTHSGPPTRVQLVPEAPTAIGEAVAAVEEADLVLLGPGSLYTSVIPNLLVPGILEGLKRRQGRCVWIANLMSQPSETAGLDLEGHLEAIAAHAPGLELDAVLLNDAPITAEIESRYRDDGATALRAPEEDNSLIWTRPLAAIEGGVLRHDPAQLREAVRELLERS